MQRVRASLHHLYDTRPLTLHTLTPKLQARLACPTQPCTAAPPAACAGAEVRERDADGRVWSWPEDIETDSEGEDAPQGAQAAGGASQRRRQRQRGGSEQAAGGAPFIPEPVRLARSGVQDPLFGTYAGALRDAKEATERLPKLLGQPTAADSSAEATAEASSSSSSNSSDSNTSSSGTSSGSSRAPVGPFGAGASTSSGSSFAKGAVPQGGSGGSSGGTLRLFSYGVDAGSIWSVGSALRLEGRLELCDRLEEADAVLALRSRLKASEWGGGGGGGWGGGRGAAARPASAACAGVLFLLGVPAGR